MRVTADDLVRIFHARGNHPVWRAVCPVHEANSGRGAALTLKITADDEKGRYSLTCFAGCDTDHIWEAVGMTWKDSFFVERKSTPESRRISAMHRQLEIRERRLGLMDWLVVMQPDKRRYWEAAVRGTEQEIIQMRRELWPDKMLPVRLRGSRS